MRFLLMEILLIDQKWDKPYHMTNGNRSFSYTNQARVYALSPRVYPIATMAFVRFGEGSRIRDGRA